MRTALARIGRRKVLDDPREIPYLLIWKGDSDSQIKEAVRLLPYSPQQAAESGFPLVFLERAGL